jgi:hypothetical protein
VTILSPELRSSLERAIVAARDAAEEACRVALGVLGVGVERVSDHLGEDDRRLRVALRAEARQLGGFDRLVEECGYEHWHRMLFARFLAENELLMHPMHGVALSLGDCEEIARERGIADLWVVATDFASAMLPGIFRPDDPALRLRLAPEGQYALEGFLAALPTDVFISDDGLGWVYQYWQAKKKKEVNASERKIGGADIAPVTQLFTEHYMVRFLLENTLGGWWAGRHPDSPLIEEWKYLRVDEDGKPAAGTFSCWPETVAEVTVMDPCCGSGHFLVTSFDMLRQMRMEAEGLSAGEAGDAVLRDNLFGLELDARCTQIAAFALALQAWKTGGYREIPLPNVACSGISAAGRLEDWKKLGADDMRLELSLERLHGVFAEAADIGSLIDPLRDTDGDLLAARFEEVAPLLERALRPEAARDPSGAVFGSAAASAARAGSLLARQYTLVVTNPPYLGRGMQGTPLRNYLERNYLAGKDDLAAAFALRLFEMSAPYGAVAAVLPQYLLYINAHARFRAAVRERTPLLFARLGAHAFTSIGGTVVQCVLAVFMNEATASSHVPVWIEASEGSSPNDKDVAIQLSSLHRTAVAGREDAPFVPSGDEGVRLLAEYGRAWQGLVTGDVNRYCLRFWEPPECGFAWRKMVSAPDRTQDYRGRTTVLRWEGGKGSLVLDSRAHNFNPDDVIGKQGVLIAQVGYLAATLYNGEPFHDASCPLIPIEPDHLPAIWAYCSSPEYAQNVRQMNQSIVVRPGYLTQVPFDFARWSRIAAENYPNGLPLPESGDPTQWLFQGHVSPSTTPLHVAVARLVGYRWPAQREDQLDGLIDEDGVACIPSLRGDQSASERLRGVLAAAFPGEWEASREADLLSSVGYAGMSLEQWLREAFFEQHCQLFHQRPFVWQVWDGRKDGFSALVNYHRLDRATLEKLAYTYVGDWVRQQQVGVEAGTTGSDL